MSTLPATTPEHYLSGTSAMTIPDGEAALVDQVKAAIERDEFPLFVCEGTTEEKQAYIRRSPGSALTAIQARAAGVFTSTP